MLLTGLVLRRVLDETDLVPLPHVAVDAAALVLRGVVANLAAVDVAHHHLKGSFVILEILLLQVINFYDH